MAEEKKDETPKRVKDDRKIVKGVQILDGAEYKTFAGEDDTDLDALEELLTPEMHDRLVEDGSIEGKWHPKGKPAPPMEGSRAARQAAGPHGSRPLGNTELEAENVRLRRQVKDLEGKVNKAADVGDKEVEKYEARIKELEAQLAKKK